MIETSPFMRKTQYRTLCSVGQGSEEEPEFYKSYSSKYSDSIKIHWISDINELPHKNAAQLFLANEFFDALPVQKFQVLKRLNLVCLV
jgi:SAM-dependent MidA family methyltransferase